MKKILQHTLLLCAALFVAITTRATASDEANGFPAIEYYSAEPAAFSSNENTGGSEVTERVLPSARPTTLRVGQNYPNPFNPITQISFSLPERSAVKLTIYNAVGNPMMVLVDGVRESGVYQVKVDLSAYPGGIYFYRFETPNVSQMRRMMLSK